MKMESTAKENNNDDAATAIAKPSVLTVQNSFTQCSHFVRPAECSKNGMIYAGEILSLLDLLSLTCAFKHCRGPVVTVTIDSVNFVSPAYAHDTLAMTARVNAAFGSSLEIEVLVEVEDLLTRKTRICCTGYLVFVHLNAKSLKPLQIPLLKTESDEEKARAQAAIRRKQEREAERKRSSLQSYFWRKQWPREEAALQKLKPESSSSSSALSSSLDETIALVPVAECESDVSKVILPQHTNTINIVFGGQVMAWMEQAAAIAASRLSRKTGVVSRLDRMSFHKASKVGDILYIKARVTRVFGKSLEVHVKVLSFDGNCTQFSNAGYFTFVTMDADEKQVVPVGKQVQPISDQEKKEFCEALCRRQARL